MGVVSMYTGFSYLTIGSSGDLFVNTIKNLEVGVKSGDFLAIYFLRRTVPTGVM
jgi:hypothetical protein